MFNLLAKDILLLRKQMVFGFLYIIFLLFIFKNVEYGAPAIAMSVFTYLMVVTSCSYDDKNNSDVMLNCLPIRREKIVLTKYLSIFLYSALGAVTYALFTGVIKALQIPLKVYPMNVQGIVAGIIGVIFMFGIYFPVFFKYGYNKSRILSFLLFFLLFFGITFIIDTVKKAQDNYVLSGITDFLQSKGDSFISILIILAAILFIVLSYLMSVLFYKRREF